MRNKILLSLLFIIIAIVLVLIGIWVGKESNNQLKVVDDIACESVGNSTIESGFYNFKITYPINLVLGASSIPDSIGQREINFVDEDTVLWETDKWHNGITIDVLFNLKGLSLEEFVNNIIASSVTLNDEKILWNKSNIVVGGKSAIKLTPISPEWKKKQKNEEIYIESPTFGSSHIIKITKLNEDNNSFDQVFQGILDSLEFTDERIK